MNITVALDGPAGVGKSTVAKRVARALGYRLVDTGAIYRVVALEAVRQKIAPDDDNGLAAITQRLEISFKFVADTNHVLLGTEDVTAAIRTEEISRLASLISARPVVRAGLIALQRRLAGQGGAVLEGRDIGTVICPNAEVKFFLDASVEERASRRHRELQAKGQEIPFADVLAQVKQRDHNDRTRAIAPLIPAPDAIQLDCTKLAADDVVKIVVEAVRAC